MSVLDVTYEAATPPLVFERPAVAERERADFLADDELRLYYAGDFCSKRAPGFEAAALSGVDVAEHIRERLASGGLPG